MKNKNYTYTVCGKYPGDKLKGKKRYANLYHYTSWDAFVRIWITKRLNFSSIERVNDILEKIGNSITVPTLHQAPLIWAYNEIRKSYKQVSFTMDYDSYIKGCMSPMMWGHYGNKGNGVCIEFDFERMQFPDDCWKSPVDYKMAVPKTVQIDIDVCTTKQLHQFLKKEKRIIFFTKQKSWEQENEYRVISHSAEYIDVSSAISAIYLTSCTSQECELVENIVGTVVPIKYIHYIDSKNRAIPVVTDTRTDRNDRIAAQQNPKNILNDLSKKSLELYESNKHNEDAVLLLKNIMSKK